MTVAVHQPQYLPWLSYFKKIEECDLFVFLDSVDFQKNGLQNRNQIKMSGGLGWLTVPVRQKAGQKIFEVKIDNHLQWPRKHWLSIQSSYHKAAAFKKYGSEIEAWYSHHWENLCDLNYECLKSMMRWMKIHTPTQKSSQMNLKGSASELILNICRETKATRYLSGLGAKAYLVENAFRDAGVEIIFQDPISPREYPQQFPGTAFCNNLSALDLLLNVGELWRTYLPRVQEVMGQ